MTSAAAIAPRMNAPNGTRPFSAYEWMIAGRYLRARRKEGFISVIAGFSFTGIMLGVATLIIVMAVMNGFRNELFAKILGLNGHIIVNKIGGPFDDYDAVGKRVAAVPGVKVVLPLIEGQVMVSSAVQATGALVRGMTEDGLKALPLIADNIRFGTLNGFGEGSGIAIGTRLANMLRVNVGDTITLVSPRGAADAVRHRAAHQALRDQGAVRDGHVRVRPHDGVHAAPGGAALFLARLRGRCPGDRHQRARAGRCVRAAIRDAAGPGNHISDWRQRNETFFTVLAVERNVMFIILSLIVLVAALNIISGLMMLVKDKGRDIAILRTMGATRGAMMRVFLITGASIGVVGTIAGLDPRHPVLPQHRDRSATSSAWLTDTTLFDPNVYYLTRLPADMDVRETVSIVGMALVLSVLATLYPSWRASTLDPVEALRYE